MFFLSHSYCFHRENLFLTHTYKFICCPCCTEIMHVSYITVFSLAVCVLVLHPALPSQSAVPARS